MEPERRRCDSKVDLDALQLGNNSKILHNLEDAESPNEAWWTVHIDFRIAEMTGVHQTEIVEISLQLPSKETKHIGITPMTKVWGENLQSWLGLAFGF